MTGHLRHKMARALLGEEPGCSDTPRRTRVAISNSQSSVLNFKLPSPSSGWGLWPALSVARLTESLCSAAEDPLTLLPPRGTLTASFWEQHGWLVVLVLCAVMACAAVAIWRLRRPKPVAVVPPATIARQALQALHNSPEDDPLVLRVSQILRHYLTVALEFPPAEFTTAEFEAALRGHPRVAGELAAALTGFLRDCDVWKFAPTRSRPLTRFAPRALALVDQVEAQQAGPVPPTPQTP
jgi:hypothetical protein